VDVFAVDPEPTDSTTRRALLTLVAGATVGFAGCQTGRSDGTPSDSQERDPTESETPRPTETEGPGPTESETTAETTQSEDERRCVSGERQVGEASVSVDGAWSQFQAGPENAGYSADATGPTDPSLAWRFATCAPLRDSPPVVAGGSVYLGGDSLRAFDAASGEVEWEADDLVSPTAPVVAEDAVYFAGRDLTAVDRTDGTVVWRDERESDTLAHDSPTLADGTLYVPGAVDDPTLRAFDATTGEQRWELALDGEFGPGVPAVVGDRVFITDDGYRLVGVDTDGSSTQVIAGGPDDTGVFSPPAVSDGTVYVGGMEGRLRAFDAASGEQRWARGVSGGGVPGPPVVGDGRLYVVNSGMVHALTTDGQTLWERPSEEFGLGQSDLGLPIRAGETLYVGGFAGARADDGDPAGFVSALDVADGSERWTYTTRGYWDDSGNPDIQAGTFAPVAVADEAVFVATGAGDLYALG
jgi:outer membrane protein assembly factor BamB